MTSEPGEHLIELSHVRRDYTSGGQTVSALKDLTLLIPTGSFMAITGPSGSGKSTLLQIIGCLDRPTSGRYWLSGRDIDQLEAVELAKIRNRHIGFVFQSYTLLPRVSAADKVALPLHYRGLDWRDAKYKAMEALAKVGAEDLSDRTSNQLSGGQQQRVAIARAIVGQPDIVLADEPTGALERQSGDHIMEIFAQLNDAGMTVLAITHDDHVAGYCKQRFTMSEGCLQSDPGTARPTVGDASFS